MYQAFSRVMMIGLCMAFVLSANCPAQILVVGNPILDRVDLVGPNGVLLASLSNLGNVRFSCTDGTTVAWLSDASAGRIRRIELESLIVTSFEVPGIPRALSQLPNGGCAVVSDLGTQGLLLFVDADGVITNSYGLGIGAQQLARGADGEFLVAEFVGVNPGLLRRFDAEGDSIGLHPIGSLATRILVANDKTVWVLCGFVQELWHYGPQGDLLQVVALPPGARDINQDRAGQLVVSYPTIGMLEYRDLQGLLIWTVPGPGAFRLLRDGNGRLWAADAMNGKLVAEDDWDTVGAGVTLSAGVGVSGSESAYAYASSGGGNADTDGDGVVNAYEVQVTTDPFDSQSTPFASELTAPLQPGLTTTIHFRSSGTPNLIYQTGISHGPAAENAGALGMRLQPGPLFDWYQSSATGVIVFGVLGFFDALGDSYFPIFIPDLPTLSGLRFWVGFRVLTEFPDFTVGLSAPAVELEIE
ncbi:MAG: thrombospondin type 3 repeat-containing protein [Planctomycetota bacterium]